VVTYVQRSVAAKDDNNKNAAVEERLMFFLVTEGMSLPWADTSVSVSLTETHSHRYQFNVNRSRSENIAAHAFRQQELEIHSSLVAHLLKANVIPESWQLQSCWLVAYAEIAILNCIFLPVRITMTS